MWLRGDTHSTDGFDSEYDSQHDCDMYVQMNDDMDEVGRVDLHGDVDIQWDGDKEDEEGE